jgi:hypothetical protein
MIDNALERNDGNTSSISIILQYNKHFSSELVSDGLETRVSEEIHEIPLCWVMIINLRSNMLDVAFELKYLAGGYSTPPLVRDLAAGQNNDHAVGVIVISLVIDI